MKCERASGEEQSEAGRRSSKRRRGRVFSDAVERVYEDSVSPFVTVVEQRVRENQPGPAGSLGVTIGFVPPGVTLKLRRSPGLAPNAKAGLGSLRSARVDTDSLVPTATRRSLPVLFDKPLLPVILPGGSGPEPRGRRGSDAERRRTPSITKRQHGRHRSRKEKLEEETGSEDDGEEKSAPHGRLASPRQKKRHGGALFEPSQRRNSKDSRVWPHLFHLSSSFRISPLEFQSRGFKVSGSAVEGVIKQAGDDSALPASEGSPGPLQNKASSSFRARLSSPSAQRRTARSPTRRVVNSFVPDASSRRAPMQLVL
ncbi:hypothetical protein EYF80_048904 [Liparis tanakae]|uniref:Uncharacterized protein n=1 Tax=Liparis tanakae TaxID=230148 RepID=A0A4Z2FIA8_9TELE|nr:hypothetical protein EYF80_048904 [Liparis tanakae]